MCKVSTSDLSTKIYLECVVPENSNNQYNNSSMNFYLYKEINVQFSLLLSESYSLNSAYNTEVALCSDVELDRVVMGGGQKKQYWKHMSV